MADDEVLQPRKLREVAPVALRRGVAHAALAHPLAVRKAALVAAAARTAHAHPLVGGLRLEEVRARRRVRALLLSRCLLGGHDSRNVVERQRILVG